MKWVSWRTGRNFTRWWHLSSDRKVTLCSQTIDGLLNYRTSDPSPDQQCYLCRKRHYEGMQKEQPNGVS